MTKLHSKLYQFTGTEAYHRLNPLFGKVIATDGVKFLCEEMKCFWLFDIIASHLLITVKTPIEFAYVDVIVQDDRSCTVTIHEERLDPDTLESEDVILAQQELEIADLPPGDLRVYVGVQPIQGQNYYVLMLTSEY